MAIETLARKAKREASDLVGYVGDPHVLLPKVTLAYRAAIGREGAPRHGIDALYNRFHARWHATPGHAAARDERGASVEQQATGRALFALARETLETLEALADLPKTDLQTIAAAQEGTATPAAEALFAQHPALARWHADLIAEQRRLAAAQQAEVGRMVADAPAGVLRRLRVAGVKVTLDERGNIVAPRDQVHLIPEPERRAIREHKAALVSLLQAEAEAGRPVVLA